MSVFASIQVVPGKEYPVLVNSGPAVILSGLIYRNAPDEYIVQDETGQQKKFQAFMKSAHREGDCVLIGLEDETDCAWSVFEIRYNPITKKVWIYGKA